MSWTFLPQAHVRRGERSAWQRSADALLCSTGVLTEGGTILNRARVARPVGHETDILLQDAGAHQLRMLALDRYFQWGHQFPPHLITRSYLGSPHTSLTQ
jgi:hypothetical protein